MAAEWATATSFAKEWDTGPGDGHLRDVGVAKDGHIVFRMVYEVLKCRWQRRGGKINSSLRKLEMEVLNL